MGTERRVVWLLLGFVGLLSVPLPGQTLPAEQPCPTIDRATFDKMMQIAADAIAEGKTRAVTFRGVRLWCKAQEPPILFSTKERNCWHGVVGDMHIAARLERERQARKQAERKREEEKAEHPEWYALAPEEQARVLAWLKRPTGASLPPLEFTAWFEHGSECPPLTWRVRTRKIGDAGRVSEPARVWKIIDAHRMIVSIGSHQTECERLSGWKYRRQHDYGVYDADVTRIVVDGVNTKGLVFNTRVNGNAWGSMRIARTTAEFGETMYVIEPSPKPSGELMAVRVPPSVLQAHGLR